MNLDESFCIVDKIFEIVKDEINISDQFSSRDLNNLKVRYV